MWSNDGEVYYGIVGTIEDLIKIGLITHSDYDPLTWQYLPDRGIMQKPWMGKTKEEALENLNL